MERGEKRKEKGARGRMKRQDRVRGDNGGRMRRRERTEKGEGKVDNRRKEKNQKRERRNE